MDEANLGKSRRSFSAAFPRADGEMRLDSDWLSMIFHVHGPEIVTENTYNPRLLES